MVRASPQAVYRAFAAPGALEQWLPPHGMTGEMLHFDFREGGSYRMRLTYAPPEHGRGKSSSDADDVTVRLTTLEDGRRIEQAVTFESTDPAFAGVMRMTWSFTSQGDGTLVTVRAEEVPSGISAEDHAAGLRASLATLADFVDGVDR
ncbi:MAG: SRPBCC domain-containing protein [Gemmatimonadaceae bacterium]|nr:SRPBCC domain-containing protein [Gemmatimonadaceae bacterium]